MNTELLQAEVQDFVAQNYKNDLSKMAFQGSPFSGVSTRELVEQLAGKKKSETKLPTWFATRGIIYPPTINLEQTSSEIAAAYKASLVQGATLADLTGGFGIDAYFFSEKIREVYHLEIDDNLQKIAAHNFEVLGAKNVISKCVDGLTFLKQHDKKLDWLYLDPSRRDGSGGRVFFLSDCEPDIPENLALLQRHAGQILIKTSPLLDLEAGLRELKNVHEIHILAVENEVKELLWLLKATPSENPLIKTLNFKKSKIEKFEAPFKNVTPEKYGFPKQFLYEPNVAIMKSGMFGILGETLQLEKLHANSQLFTSEKLIDIPGRRFKIEKILPFKNKILKRELKALPASISVRNFPLSVSQLRKQFKIKEGRENYLFFTTNLSEERILLFCKKI